MAVKNYTGWATNVNRIILDSTSITLGENALKTDEIENGGKRSRLKGSYCPDKYQVTMDFDWIATDENGMTEIQRFYEWYKYVHKYGSVPFEFPKILYSHETGVASESYGSRVEYYKITSAVEGKKYGTSQRVTMTWETVFAGVVSIQQEENNINDIIASRGIIDVFFNIIGTVAPLQSDFSVLIDNTPIELTGYYYDNATQSRLYFDASELDNNSHTVKVTYNGITISDVIPIVIGGN